METYEAIKTKLEVREFSSQIVPVDVKLKILEAARLTASGMNSQHWRFILVQEHEDLKKLAADSTTGPWIVAANFAVIVLTAQKYPFHLIDAGRVVQDMELATWNFGVATGVFTGVKEQELRKDFEIPKELSPSMIVGFGYPAKKISGKRKNRKPLTEIVFLEKYGKSFDPKAL